MILIMIFHFRTFTDISLMAFEFAYDCKGYALKNIEGRCADEAWPNGLSSNYLLSRRATL